MKAVCKLKQSLGWRQLPSLDRGFDRVYSQKTGVARKKILDVRDRRANVIKHHLIFKPITEKKGYSEGVSKGTSRCGIV